MSGYREKLDSETGFNPVVQAQFEVSFPQAAAQLVQMNVCFVDYFCSISCHLSWISDSLLSGLKLSYLWVVTQMKPSKAWVKLQKFSIATVFLQIREFPFYALRLIRCLPEQRCT